MMCYESKLACGAWIFVGLVVSLTSCSALPVVAPRIECTYEYRRDLHSPLPYYKVAVCNDRVTLLCESSTPLPNTVTGTCR